MKDKGANANQHFRARLIKNTLLTEEEMIWAHAVRIFQVQHHRRRLFARDKTNYISTPLFKITGYQCNMIAQTIS